MIDDGDNVQQQPHVESNSTSNFADAQLIDLSDPHRPPVVVATTVAAETTAIPLDPWSNKPTEASIMAQSPPLSTYSNGQEVSPYHQVQVIQASNNPSYPYIEDPLQKKLRRRRRRRGRMAVGGVSGFVVGSLVLGPIGAVVGTVTGVTLARGVSKIGEKRKDRRVRRQLERAQAESRFG